MPEHSIKTWVPSDESRKNGLKKIKLVTGSVKVVKQSIQPLLYYFCSIGQKKKNECLGKGRSVLYLICPHRLAGELGSI